MPVCPSRSRPGRWDRRRISACARRRCSGRSESPGARRESSGPWGTILIRSFSILPGVFLLREVEAAGDALHMRVHHHTGGNPERRSEYDIGGLARRSGHGQQVFHGPRDCTAEISEDGPRRADHALRFVVEETGRSGGPAPSRPGWRGRSRAIVGYFGEQSGRDLVHALVGALRREDGRDQQFPGVAVVERTGRLRIQPSSCSEILGSAWPDARPHFSDAAPACAGWVAWIGFDLVSIVASDGESVASPATAGIQTLGRNGSTMKVHRICVRDARTTLCTRYVQRIRGSVQPREAHASVAEFQDTHSESEDAGRTPRSIILSPG